MKMDITEKTLGIVILNYLNYKDTLECVKSLLGQSYKAFYIVIVDNHSANESYQVLRNKFFGVENISVVQTSANLGFAKGNNQGIKILKEMGIRKVLVSNNDVIFFDKYYLEHLVDLKYKSCVGMIGTAIINADGGNHNPVPVSNLTYGRFRMYEIAASFKCWSTRYVPGIKKLYDFKHSLVKKETSSQHIDGSRTHILNPEFEMLHGSVLYFTENFLNEYDGFYPGTFLYVEEDILNLLCQRTGMRQMYVSSIVVKHKEDGSSDMAWENRDKRKMKSHYQRQSLRCLDSLRRKPVDQLKSAFLQC